MDDWRDRILLGIRESRLLLACLSPAFLDSPHCAWEFNEYLNHEVARALIGDGVAPVYLVDIPGWTGSSADQKLAGWIGELRRRQHVDLRIWYEEGADALHHSEVAVRMKELSQQIRDRLKRTQRALDAGGNLDRHNENFVGRRTELSRLHELVGRGKIGVLTAVHGLGGIGKTALAVEYAHAFADEYPGGCWQARCEGREDLRAVFTSLVGTRGLDFALTEEEKKDPERAFERVLIELRRRADSATPSRVLVILDNVDRPGLLSPTETCRLPAAHWLNVVVTTRMGEPDMFPWEKDRAFLPVDELPEDDALALIETYQPGGAFRDGQEQAAAREIVRTLGGFTLAVEIAAVLLGRFAGDVTCADYLTRLRRELAGKSDLPGADGMSGIRHGEEGLRATLQPTLDRLSPPERLALSYAALLPADQIAVQWLRVLVAARHPEMGRDAQPGFLRELVRLDDAADRGRRLARQDEHVAPFVVTPSLAPARRLPLQTSSSRMTQDRPAGRSARPASPNRVRPMKRRLLFTALALALLLIALLGWTVEAVRWVATGSRRRLAPA